MKMIQVPLLHQESVPHIDTPGDEPRLYISADIEPRRSGHYVLVLPGGGYQKVSPKKKITCRWLARLGYRGFILEYRLPRPDQGLEGSLIPYRDACDALFSIRRWATGRGETIKRVGLLGFSAGGHLAGTVGTRWLAFGSANIPAERPDFQLLIYPVISMAEEFVHGHSRSNLIGSSPDPELEHLFSIERHVSHDTPPTYLAHAIDDKTVPWKNSLAMFQALQREGRPSELHLHEVGGHGYTMNPDVPAGRSWPKSCAVWLQRFEQH